VKIDSKVTLAVDCADTPGQCHAYLFHGRVKSSEHTCEVQRKVKMFSVSVRPGRDRLVGTDRSNRHGKWRVVVEMARGQHRFYAKVVRREVRTAGTTFVCRGDRSRLLDLH
jgi:hypothetical protein